MAGINFIECTSLSFSYSVLGLVTVNYTMVHNEKKFVALNTISAGGRVFKGYIMDASMNAIPNTSGWYETNVTMIATTN
jgi:hypothetical protein